MSIKNQIFQVQNAIFQTLVEANLGVDVVANRGVIVNYPYIIIAGTKKEVMSGLQVKTLTEINVVTKDFSIISSSIILQNIENYLQVEELAKSIELYAVNHAQVVSSETVPTQEGFFMGKIIIEVILN
jgi:hypothetical protein